MNPRPGPGPTTPTAVPAHEARTEADRVEEVLRREAPSLLAYLLRRTGQDADAADLLAEVLLVAWRRAADLPTDGIEARKWLFGVARRTLSTHRRGLLRRAELTARLTGELAAARTSGNAPAEDPRLDALDAALATLPDRDQELIALVHWHGFSLVEAADVLGVRAATARSRYHRARHRLQELITSP